jgi:hypothetical protein
MKKTIKRIKSKYKLLSDLEAKNSYLCNYSNNAIKKLKRIDRKHIKKSIKEYEEKRKALKDSIKGLHTYLSYQIQEALEEQELLLTPIFEGTIHQYRYKARFILTNEELIRVKGYDLLSSKGLYNRENNILGVVKDHRLSIKFGFENSIDPKVIGHPANCEFLYYSQNASKGSNSSITLEELLELIKNW